MLIYQGNNFQWLQKFLFSPFTTVNPNGINSVLQPMEYNQHSVYRVTEVPNIRESVITVPKKLC